MCTPASPPRSNSKGKNGSGGAGAHSGSANSVTVTKSKAPHDTAAAEDSELGLALLIPDIQGTAKIVKLASQRLKQKNRESNQYRSLGLVTL